MFYIFPIFDKHSNNVKETNLLQVVEIGGRRSPAGRDFDCTSRLPCAQILLRALKFHKCSFCNM